MTTVQLEPLEVEPNLYQSPEGIVTRRPQHRVAYDQNVSISIYACSILCYT